MRINEEEFKFMIGTVDRLGFYYKKKYYEGVPAVSDNVYDVFEKEAAKLFDKYDQNKFMRSQRFDKAVGG